MRGERSDEEMAAESSRRFTKNLLKPGTAAEIRQTACNAIRHSAVTVRRTGRVWRGGKMVAVKNESPPVGKKYDMETVPAGVLFGFFFFFQRRNRNASNLSGRFDPVVAAAAAPLTLAFMAHLFAGDVRGAQVPLSLG